MSNLQTMANEMAKLFVQSKNKKQAAKQIVSQINSLRYSKSQKPFDYEKKLTVIKLIYEIIYGLRPYSCRHDEFVMAELKDQILFIECIDFMIRRLDNEKAKQLQIPFN